MVLPRYAMTAPSRPQSELSSFMVLALAPLCWSGNHIVGRWVAGEVPPVPPGGLSVLRWLLAFLILLPFAWRHLRSDWPVLRANLGLVLFLFTLGGTLFSFLQYYALRYTTAINIGVLNSVAPALIVVAGVIIFRDRVRGWQMAGIASSLLGVLVIITQGALDTLLSLSFNAGDLIGLSTMTIWAVYTACLRLKPNVHWLTFMLAMTVVSCIGCLPVMAVETWAGNGLRATWMTAFAVVYVAVFSSLVAYMAWTYGIISLGSHRAGAFLHLIPLFSAGLSIMLLGEEPRLFHAVGLALIVTGVTIAVRRQG